MMMLKYNEHTGFLCILSLPLAYRLEKSDSVRLKRASPPLLSQDSRFLAVRSLKELTILLLSSRLLFFCRNPKYEEEESGGWKHFPNMMRAAAFSTITCTITSTSVFVFLQFICLSRFLSHSVLSLPLFWMRRDSHSVLFTDGWGLIPLWEVEASDISTKLQSGKNKWLSFSGCKFLLRHVVHFTVQRRTQVVIHSYEYMNTNKIIQLKTSDIYSLTLILNKKSLFLCFFLSILARSCGFYLMTITKTSKTCRWKIPKNNCSAHWCVSFTSMVAVLG